MVHRRPGRQARHLHVHSRCLQHVPSVACFARQRRQPALELRSATVSPPAVDDSVRGATTKAAHPGSGAKRARRCAAAAAAAATATSRCDRGAGANAAAGSGTGTTRGEWKEPVGCRGDGGVGVHDQRQCRPHGHTEVVGTVLGVIPQRLQQAEGQVVRCERGWRSMDAQPSETTCCTHGVAHHTRHFHTRRHCTAALLLTSTAWCRIVASLWHNNGITISIALPPTSVDEDSADSASSDTRMSVNRSIGDSDATKASSAALGAPTTPEAAFKSLANTCKLAPTRSSLLGASTPIVSYTMGYVCATACRTSGDGWQIMVRSRSRMRGALLAAICARREATNGGGCHGSPITGHHNTKRKRVSS